MQPESRARRPIPAVLLSDIDGQRNIINALKRKPLQECSNGFGEEPKRYQKSRADTDQAFLHDIEAPALSEAEGQNANTEIDAER